MQEEIIEPETKQLTLLDFNALAEEIKILTKEILKNRWEIAEKLFYIKNHWNKYKQQKDFPYKTFNQFIKHYYNWTRDEAHKYLDAHELKLLLEEKRITGYTLDDIGISVADKLYTLAKIDTDKVIEIIEEKSNITRKEVKNIIKQIKREQKSKAGEKIQIDDNEIDLRLGDFWKVLNNLPDNSINLILTDPPYPIEFIDEWYKLGGFAKKKLKPNGFCICYSGQKNLLEVMKRMNKYLDYYWMFSLLHKDNKQLIQSRNIFCGWKPLLIYQNGFKKLDVEIEDIVEGTGRNKENHDWEQSLEELRYLIDNFSEPGDIICDPFAGSGTTLIAAKKNNRIGIGAEINKDFFNIAKKRIKDELG